jgi:hypothetical protein
MRTPHFWAVILDTPLVPVWAVLVVLAGCICDACGQAWRELQQIRQIQRQQEDRPPEKI